MRRCYFTQFIEGINSTFKRLYPGNAAFCVVRNFNGCMFITILIKNFDSYPLAYFNTATVAPIVKLDILNIKKFHGSRARFKRALFQQQISLFNLTKFRKQALRKGRKKGQAE